MVKKNKLKPVSPGSKTLSRAPKGTKAGAKLIAQNRVLAKANENLRAQSREFQTIARDLTHLLSSTDIALLFVDKELRVRGFTPTMRDLLSISSHDLGRNIERLERHFEDPSLLPDMQQALRAHKTREAEIVSRNGRVFVRLALPYRTEGRRVEGVVLTFIEITRRKLAETALRTSEERQRMILDSVAEYAILLLDLEGRFVTWTASAQRILGYTPDEAIGQKLKIIHTEEERNRNMFEHELTAARARKSITVERWHMRKDGTRFWGTGVLSSLYDENGRLYGYVKILRDNTERKLAVEALRQAKIDAELANSAKDFFLANVSHELRTPLSAMLLWAKLLRSQKQVDPEQLREGLDAIVKSAEEQQALIEDLMDTTRITSGKMRLEMEAVPLTSLVQKVLNITHPAAAAKGLKLESELDPRSGTVWADGLRLQQVLVNLLNNAVKFTPEGGRITVTMRRLGSEVEIQIADTGQGISPEFIGRIFERFTQADDAAIRVNGGLGLGLSISRNLVQLHGGSITAQSEGLAKGTTFTVRLPLPALGESPQSDEKPSDPPSLEGARVLLVEDLVQTRRALAAVLTEAKASVCAVGNAPDALKSFTEDRPSLILSDIGLGKVSGHELIAQIRDWERSQRIQPVPAIALTAYADDRNRHLAMESGFQDVLTKPVEPLVLIKALARLNKSS
jgi:PAS domain S-box-containing protein